MSKAYKRVSYYERKSLRAYWSVHVESWLRSGVSRQRYCDDHGLHRRTMKRWLTALETPLPKRRRIEKKPAKVRLQRLPARGSRAFMAFWLMHLEALRASGLSATAYAAAHRLPERKLRTLRQRFARTPPAQDWRGMLHPGVPSSIQSGANLRYELRYGRPSTADLREELSTGLWISTAASSSIPATSAAPSAVSRKRRQFTDAQKLAMVAEFADPDVSVASVARRYAVSTSMLFRWRDEFGLAPKQDPLLVTAHVIERPRRGRPKQHSPLVLHDLLPTPEGMTAVELADGRRVFAPTGSDPDAVRHYIAEQESCA